MGIEYELKFAATREQQAQIHREFPGDSVTYQMETTYYDTPAGSFSARQCTLRRRMENHISVCTLKAPSGPDSRKEWEVECDSIENAISLLVQHGADPELLALAEEGLVPVCGAKFTRIAKTLNILDGTLELALDAGILTGGGTEIPLCEVEVEQKTCPKAVCEAFANALRQQYDLIPEPRSKFARAHALYKGE